MSTFSELFLDYISGDINFDPTDFEKKIDSYKITMDIAESKIEFLKEKEKEIAQKRKTLENKVTWLKENIKTAMLHLDRDRLEGQVYSFTLSKLESKILINEELLSKEYFKEKKDLIPDKDKIKELLNSGEVIEGATFANVYSLRRS